MAVYAITLNRHPPLSDSRIGLAQAVEPKREAAGSSSYMVLCGTLVYVVLLARLTCAVRVAPLRRPPPSRAAAFWRVATEPAAPVMQEVPVPAPVEGAPPTEPVAEAPIAAPVDAPLPGTMLVVVKEVGGATVVPALMHGARVLCNAQAGVL